ncbi:MAG: EamA-like transporter family protein [Candidatus Methanofastidiosum methylothiophilum]|uniref:EamA-like transporter family protein n=1 Tax=Candidatus Methanofastidiosum methylothiophilum TaxID=1705564 RepID=A0A150IXC3_9EURY|nr:MAG: EamA-like transporter family protein [Candidatus Methanofastidiosum methylthiophilus]
MDSKDNYRGVSYTFLAVILWSFIGIPVRWIPEVNSGMIVAYRFLFASIVLLIYGIFTKKSSNIKINVKDVPYLLVPAILLSFTIYTYTIGLKTTTIANTVFLQQMAPLYVLVVSALLLKEKASKKTALAVLIGIAGGFIIFYYDLSSINVTTNFYGNVMSTFSGFGWALYTISIRALGKKYDGLTTTLWMFIFATIIMSPFFYGSEILTPFSLSMLFILGFLCTAGAFLLYSIALKHIIATKASIIVLSEGVLAGILAYLILNETVTNGTIIGGALILISIVIILREK